MKTTTTVIAMVGVWFFGNATWILGIVNFVWLLVKNVTLFSWWWVIGSAIGALISLIVAGVSVLKR